MKFLEFTEHKHVLKEAGPAAVALPVGLATMEAMAIALGFSGAAALAIDIQTNPNKYNKATQYMGQTYTDISNWLKSNDDSTFSDVPAGLSSQLEIESGQALRTQKREVRDAVSVQTQEIIDQVDKDADAAADMVAGWTAQARADTDAAAIAAQSATQAPSGDGPEAFSAADQAADIAGAKAANLSRSPSQPSVASTDTSSGAAAMSKKDSDVSRSVPSSLSTPDADAAPKVDTTPASVPKSPAPNVTDTSPAQPNAPVADKPANSTTSRDSSISKSAPSTMDVPDADTAPDINIDIPDVPADNDVTLDIPATSAPDVSTDAPKQPVSPAAQLPDITAPDAPIAGLPPEAKPRPTSPAKPAKPADDAPPVAPPVTGPLVKPGAGTVNPPANPPAIANPAAAAGAAAGAAAVARGARRNGGRSNKKGRKGGVLPGGGVGPQDPGKMMNFTPIQLRDPLSLGSARSPFAT